MADQRKASHGRLDVSSEGDEVDQSNLPLRGCAHIHQHRRGVRLARGGFTALAVLFIGSALTAAVTVGQRNHADAAQHTAITGDMVAQADRIRDLDPRGAPQLGVVANDTVIASDRTHQDQPRRLGQPL
ncbi:MAG: hypothetical protein M3302_07035, partial [Actinomycetota bacterium]|nr:hypothetical protein [Actinomycetota bacterium]